MCSLCVMTLELLENFGLVLLKRNALNTVLKTSTKRNKTQQLNLQLNLLKCPRSSRRCGLGAELEGIFVKLLYCFSLASQSDHRDHEGCTPKKDKLCRF